MLAVFDSTARLRHQITSKWTDYTCWQQMGKNKPHFVFVRYIKYLNRGQFETCTFNKAVSMSFRPKGEILVAQWRFNHRFRRFLLVPRRNDIWLVSQQKCRSHFDLSLIYCVSPIVTDIQPSPPQSKRLTLIYFILCITLFINQYLIRNPQSPSLVKKLLSPQNS